MNAQSRGARTRTTRGKRRTRLLVLAAVALLLGTGWLLYQRQRSETDAQAAEAEPETAEAAEGMVTVSVESPAVAEPILIRTLRAPSGGTVTAVADEGAFIRRGEPLVQFDIRAAERDVSLARIALQESEINLDRAADARARAQKALQESEALLASGAVSREQAESARDQLASAEYALRSAGLSVERTQVALDAAIADRDAAIMRAPFDGTVLSTAVTAGDFAGQNSTLMTFGDLSRLRFRAEIDEYDIGRVAVGMPVSIRSDSLEGNPLQARLESISPEAEIINNISVFRITATADNADGRLKPGMSADLVVLIARDSGIVIPARAISSVRTRNYVDVVGADGEVETRRVETGANDGATVVILEGLAEGELVRMPDRAGALPSVPLTSAAPTAPTGSSIIPLPATGGGGGGGGGR
ncbi:MAG: efflux RND transporter periplasmic adaptor subunit [Spirochaetaceae bacterium]|nr:MAG: efflux RND transporter periplasmic adaptor subunit [Spirochaetaceae bacterium]